MQHRVVYKTEFEDDTKSNESRFSDLWHSISSSEETLNRLCHPLITTPTTRVPYEYAQFEPMISQIRGYVKEFESPEDKVDMDTRYDRVATFVTDNAQRIESTAKDVTETNVNFVMELAELYLKSGHHKWAYDLYSQCRDSHFVDDQPWLWLRLAETSSGLGTKEDKVVDSINKLAEILSKQGRDPIDDEIILCTQGSLISWEYKLLNTAVKLGRMAVKLTEGSYGNDRSVRLRANLIYFELDLCIDKYPDDFYEIEKCIIDIEPLIKYIADSRNKEHLTPNHIDTLAWYHYQKARIEFSKGNNIDANTEIQYSYNLINDCINRWDKEGEGIKGAYDSTILHRNAINKLRARLN